VVSSSAASATGVLIGEEAGGAGVGGLQSWGGCYWFTSWELWLQTCHSQS
jgi:hypothetical protein